jgi:hypothetical protein
MAVKVLNTKAIGRKLERVRAAIQDKALFERVGRMAVTHIQDRTAEGLDSKLSPLKSL